MSCAPFMRRPLAWPSWRQQQWRRRCGEKYVNIKREREQYGARLLREHATTYNSETMAKNTYQSKTKIARKSETHLALGR